MQPKMPKRHSRAALLILGLGFASLLLWVLLLANPQAAQASVAEAPHVGPDMQQQGQCPSTTADICGNGICCPGEDSNNCSADCGPPPGDGGDQCPAEECSAGFHWDPDLCECIEDAGGSCGDGIPQGNEQCGEPGLGGCANHEGFPPNTAVCVNCRCTLVDPVCGDGVVTPPETCESDDQCATGNFCARCQCVPRTVPVCGDGVINQATEQCDGNALGECQECNADCQCEGPACGDGTLDAGEQCEAGIACQEEGSICDISSCMCRPGDPCEPVDEGDGGGQPGDGGDGDGGQDGDGRDGGDGGGTPGTPLTHVPINRDPNGNGGDGSGGGGQNGDGGDGNGLPGGIDPDPNGRRENCEEGDCLNPGAGVINTYASSSASFAVECCNADGTDCILYESESHTVYEAPDGSIQICSEEFDRYCRTVPGDECLPSSTDDLPNGNDIPNEIWDGIEQPLIQNSPGQLASVLPQAQTELPPLEGYVCDEPGELCIDLSDAQAFQNTLVQQGVPQDYEGLVLWDCQVPEESETSIAIVENAFPEITVIPIFTEVTWTNSDPNAHTITSDDGLFDSGELGQGQSFTHDFNLFGDFPYHSETDSGMTGIIRVVPQCEQKSLEVKGGTRACAQCTGDWCGFAPGRPECILVPYNDMPEPWQGRYDTVEGVPGQDVGDLSDDVYALICPAPPQGEVCIPIDDRMKALFEDSGESVLLADCFSGDADDNSLCPILESDFRLETDGSGANLLCFNAGEATGFEPSCGPHPDVIDNGCAFVLTGAGAEVGLAAEGADGQQGFLAGLGLWLLLLLAGLFLLIIVIVLALSRRRHVEE